MELKSSLIHSQGDATCPYHVPGRSSKNYLVKDFYFEWLYLSFAYV